MNLIAEDDLSHLGSEIIKKSLFAQTQTRCHNRDLTETGSGLTGGSYDRPQSQPPCDNPQTAH